MKYYEFEYGYEKSYKYLNIETAMATMMGPETWMDAKQTPRLLSYNNILTANSLAFDFDLGKVGFTKTRWARYVHQYLDLEELHSWIETLKLISNRGEDLFRSKDMVRRPREHKHGSCWIALTYRNNPATLILYSRVAEFPTRAILELTMAHKVGEEIAKATGKKVSDIKFTWFVSSMFFSCLHVLPYLRVQGQLEAAYARQDDIGHFIRHQMDHIAKGNVRYGPTKRMAKRLEQITAGTLAVVPINNLSLWLTPLELTTIASEPNEVESEIGD